MRKPIFVIFLSAVTLLSFLVTACSGNGGPASESTSQASSPTSAESSAQESGTAAKNSGNGVKVSLMKFTDGTEEYLKQMGNAYGIDLDVQGLPDGDQNELIVKTRAAAKELPDITLYHIGTKWYSDVLPSENLVDLSDQAWVSRIPESVRSGYMENGKVYAAPFGPANYGGFIYNKKVFEEAGIKEVPDTIQRLYDVSKEIKAKTGKTPLYLSGSDYWTLQIPGLLAILYDELENPTIIADINTNKKTYNDCLKFTNAYEVMVDMLDQGYINSDFLSATYTNAQEAISKGECGMYMVVSSTFSALNENFPDYIKDIGFFPWPIEGQKCIPTWPARTAGIANYSKNIDVCKGFLDYLCSDEAQSALATYLDGLFLPALTGVKIDASSLKGPAVDVYRLLDTSVIQITEDMRISVNHGDFGPYCQEVLLKQEPPSYVAQSLTKIFQRGGKEQGLPGF